MREAFERALSHVGVHPILGGAVWRSFLRFEQDELEDAEETSAGDGEVSKAKDRCVAELFWQSVFLRIFLPNLSSSWITVVICASVWR